MTPDQTYIDQIAAAPVRPVFIMGPHRSGTTILYRLLAETGRFNVTTAYHVLHRDRLLSLHFEGKEQEARQELEQYFRGKGLENRTFDSMPISANIPEEYCYALDPQGPRPRITAETLPSFMLFLRKVQQVQSPDRPTLLKNPFDAGNYEYIRQVVPNARFLVIHRNPVDVISSQVHAVRSLLESRNEYVATVVERYRKAYDRRWPIRLGRLAYSPRLPFLARQVERTVVGVADALLEQLRTPRPDVTQTTYPELCARPNETVRRILAALEVDAGGLKDLGSLVSPRKSTLTPDVAPREARIRKRTAEYCNTFGV